MAKYFNVNGTCKPNMHYMVNLEPKLKKIKVMIDNGQYFTINRARQYGKTTILRALSEYLKHDYTVISLDFQKMSSSDFEYESAFVRGLAREIVKRIRHTPDIPEQTEHQLLALINAPLKQPKLAEIFDCFSDWCESSSKPIVLLIDEVDTAANNQIFLDFLAQLRAYYLKRQKTPTFHSVILAGVYDIRNLRHKMQPDEKHVENSPWNIAADFLVDMSFSANEIAGMLNAYEDDSHTGMNIEKISRLIYSYTSGYPYLVSRICNYMDERLPGTKEFPDKISAWTDTGFYEAEKMIEKEDNTLYQSMIRKLKLYPELRTVLYQLLFTGKPIPYTATNDYIKDAVMFGFIRNENDTAVISNRIFESVLYNYFISAEFASSKMYNAGVQAKNQFIVDGYLDIRKILEKFIETFNDLYGDKADTFLEDI